MNIQGISPGYKIERFGKYAFALFTVFVAFLIREIFFAELLESTVPFAFFYFSIVLSCWFGGLGPGLLATCLGALISGYLYLGLHHTIYDLESQVKLGLFLINGVLFSLLSEFLRKSREQTERERSLLKAEVERRKGVEDRLRDADASKDRFLATLSHELRNPLASIRNGVEILLREKGDTSKRGRALAIMDRQTGQIVRLLDDLLDAARVRHNKLALRKTRIRLGDAINGAVESIRLPAEAKNQSLSVSVPPQDIWLDGDLTRLIQVFTNVLSNASKYTQAGGSIHLAVSKEGNRAVVAVRDNGIGIPPEIMPRLFDMFAQDDSNVGKGGLGIGLHLVRRLVEMHGGSVAARSEGPGAGSEFTIVLPAVEEPTRARQAETAPGPGPAGGELRILIVDDCKDSTMTMQWLLESLGHDVRIAKDGSSAFDAVKSFTPDFIFLDIGLPGMDGYHVCEMLREMPSLKDAVIIAQTGYGQDEDRRKSKQAGFDHHLVKPVSIEDLRDVLDRARPHGGAEVRPTSSGSAHL